MNRKEWKGNKTARGKNLIYFPLSKTPKVGPNGLGEPRKKNVSEAIVNPFTEGAESGVVRSPRGSDLRVGLGQRSQILLAELNPRIGRRDWPSYSSSSCCLSFWLAT